MKPLGQEDLQGNLTGVGRVGGHGRAGAAVAQA